jgi:hypothetical protein
MLISTMYSRAQGTDRASWFPWATWPERGHWRQGRDWTTWHQGGQRREERDWNPWIKGRGWRKRRDGTAWSQRGPGRKSTIVIEKTACREGEKDGRKFQLCNETALLMYVIFLQ